MQEKSVLEESHKEKEKKIRFVQEHGKLGLDAVFWRFSNVNVSQMKAHTHWNVQLFCTSSNKQNSCKPSLTLQLS